MFEKKTSILPGKKIILTNPPPPPLHKSNGASQSSCLVQILHSPPHNYNGPPQNACLVQIFHPPPPKKTSNGPPMSSCLVQKNTTDNQNFKLFPFQLLIKMNLFQLLLNFILTFILNLFTVLTLRNNKISIFFFSGGYIYSYVQHTRKPTEKDLYFVTTNENCTLSAKSHSQWYLKVGSPAIT